MTNLTSREFNQETGKAHASVARWAEQTRTSELFISVVSVQELEIGVLLKERKDEAQGRLLRTWLDQHVLPAFADRILPVDTAVARTSAKLHVPDPRPVRDTLIAATALVHGLTVVTRNLADFSPTGVSTLDPWSV